MIYLESVPREFKHATFGESNYRNLSINILSVKCIQFLSVRNAW